MSFRPFYYIIRKYNYFLIITQTRVVEYVPRLVVVTQAELQGKTTVEASPNSEQAGIYRRLAPKIIETIELKVPSPLDTAELRAWAAAWADHLLVLPVFNR
ncbi:Nitrogenase iron protein [Sporomusa carbonis]|uniref:hypothetical protein n=1 Tax=Sporomusa carbonis TaxID=3076075 RepID=UPI003A78796C